MKKRVKLYIILGIEVVVIVAVLLIIFFAGRKVYTVTFDLDGGILISGDLEQSIIQGNDAVPPVVTKEGCFFLNWSASYKKITRNLVIKAIWEYETTPGIQYEYLPNSNYCLISGCYKKLSGDVFVGAYYEEGSGENVKNIKVLGIKEGAFEGCTEITGIYFLDGILDIGDNAFKGCTSLKTIEIPSTVEGIGNNAFEGCSNLLKTNLPSSLTKLGANAFKDCTSLSKIVLPRSLREIGSNAFEGCSDLNIYSETEKKAEGWDPNWNNDNFDVLYGAKKVEDDETEIEYVIDNENIIIIEYTTEKETINLPDKITIEKVDYLVTKIESYAFSKCDKVINLTIPNSIIFIEEAMLYGCNKIEKLNIPFIGSQLGNSGTKDSLFGYIFGVGIKKGSNLTNQFVSKDQSKEYYIPETLEEVKISLETIIGYGAFSNCVNLKKIVLPDTITEIHDYAFSNCHNLTSIVIPKSVEIMGENVFLDCSKLNIVCEIDSKPELWNENWNPDNLKVNWDK